MKKLSTMALLFALTLSACSSAVQESETDQDLVPAEQADLVMIYEANGFTFEYPASWTVSDIRGHYLLSGDEDFWRMHVYESDIMGPRCSVEERNEEFIDSSGRSWSISIQKEGIPEGGEDICGDYVNSLPYLRSAETAVTNDNGEYLSMLFYQYDIDEEEDALAEFEKILDSIVLE
ncbi:MAG: hypothetical protein ABIH78_00770 [Candidatus Peregrinibacteria bacterium]